METFEKMLFEHSDIINLIEKWQVVRLKDVEILLRDCCSRGQYNRVSKLEKEGVLQKIKIPSKDRSRRYALVFTKSLREKVGQQYHPERFYHDLVLSSVVAALSLLPSYIQVQFEHEFEKRDSKGSFSKQGIIPDALVQLQPRSSKTEINIGIEVEMTRKSNSRIEEKFLNYSDAPVFDSAFYFFVDERSFKVYKDCLLRISSENTKKSFNKIALILINNPNSIREELEHLTTFTLERSGTFKELFL